ncbi:hypothetical protein LWI29_017228 [Acer saccharum]|uniref:Uncharacterized protein n=1 Tax=Acer saccharum TaxID=4024 RepID=A0AA39VGN2_ACESA|nr:hypothetical protein LWI29_017228 [Acer saccharum]
MKKSSKSRSNRTTAVHNSLPADQVQSVAQVPIDQPVNLHFQARLNFNVSSQIVFIDSDSDESPPEAVEVDNLTDHAMDYSDKVAKHSSQQAGIAIVPVIGAHFGSITVGQTDNASVSQISTDPT